MVGSNLSVGRGIVGDFQFVQIVIIFEFELSLVSLICLFGFVQTVESRLNPAKTLQKIHKEQLNPQSDG